MIFQLLRKNSRNRDLRHTPPTRHWLLPEAGHTDMTAQDAQ